MTAFELIFAAGSMVLYVILLTTMLSGSWVRYPFVFAYVIANLLSTVVQGSFEQYFGHRSRQFAMAYWMSDFACTLLILMIIIHLIRAAMVNDKNRNTVYCGLLLGTVMMAGTSLLLMKSHSWNLVFRRMMTEVGRDYYFAAVILNAILWMMLMRNQTRDKQLYLITSGLGLQLAGAAIAHALRMTSHLLLLSNCFLVVTYLLNFYVWYVAFKKVPAEIPVSRPVIGDISAAHPTSLPH
jgi:hypothetical protein